ncbi:MAG: YfcE family phosphodiesterase [Enterococcus sp.]
MKYLIVSDNHGDREILVDLVTKYQHEVDYFFHCGDSELASDDELFQRFIGVGGNCDYGPGFEDARLVETAVDRIYLTHGHLSDVRFGLTQLLIEAQAADANIVLFGHTHQIGCELLHDKLFLNPGSISQPRGPIQIPSYVIIESDGKNLLVQYYNRSHRALSDLQFHFTH